MAPIHPEYVDPDDRGERELAQSARGDSDLVQPRARVDLAAEREEARAELERVRQAREEEAREDLDAAGEDV